MNRASRILAVSVALVIPASGISCAGDSAEIAAPPGSPANSITCQLGCTEGDPSPTAPGFFLGSGVTPGTCTTPGLQTDADQDGLSDFCEKNLASAFAPQLWYDASDDISGEPHWASRPAADSVVVGYLFSYYRDLGNQPTIQCKLPLLFGIVVSSCNGHNGDSEQIALVLGYNASTQHWLVKRARYYRHETYADYIAGAKGYALLEYAGVAGGSPKVYVALAKHGSYKSINECNNGSFGSDTCNGNDHFRILPAGASLNIGSRAHPFRNCMESSYTNYFYYGGGRVECYWTSMPFRGWVPDSVGGGQADAYSARLTSMGF